MFRSFVLSACIAAGSLLLLGAAPAVARAQAAMADEGTFRVTVDGRSAGTEEFSIRQTGTGTSAEAVATGRVQLNLTTGTLELQTRLRGTGLQAVAVAYEVSVGGDSPQRIVGTMGSGRFSARTVSSTGERLREYVASSGAVVLDDAVAHHYYFLARRVRSGSVPIIIPRENRQVMATVTDLGEERVDVGGTTVNLFHLVIRPAGAGERHVWVDALSRVIKVEIPERNYVAVRTEIPR